MQRPVTSNPFATRWVRPGALRFVGAEQLVGQACQRLRQLPAAQIVGPHGSGKSTLLHTLSLTLQQQHWTVVHFTLQHQQRRLPAAARPLLRAPLAFGQQRRLLIVDGGQQLSRWRRMLLRRACRRGGWHLLMTTHQDLGLPTLHDMQVTAELACEVAAQLQLQSGLPKFVEDQDVRAALAGQQGNLRETLFALYDLYEARRRAVRRESGCSAHLV